MESAQPREISVIAEPPLFDLPALNDDCIIAILERVPLADLSSISMTCYRLCSLCRQVFALNQANQTCSIKYSKSLDAHEVGDELAIDGTDIRVPYRNRVLAPSDAHRVHNRCSTVAEKRMRRHLSAFGDLIKEVNFQCLRYTSIEHTDESTDNQGLTNEPLFLHMVACCSEWLQRLSVDFFAWTPELLDRTRPLLRRLTKFHTTYSVNTESILPDLINCTDLSITYQKCEAVFDRDFAHLQRFAYIQSTELGASADQRAGEFLRRHQSLRHLDLRRMNEFDLGAVVSMADLEELHIGSDALKMTDDDLLGFRCDKIKKLTLESQDEATLSAFLVRLRNSNAVNTLESIHIKSANLSEPAMQALGHFNRLETIEWHANWTDQPTAIAVPSTPRLKRLVLVDFASIIDVAPSLSLETVEIRDVRMSPELVRALGRLPRLKHLKLMWFPFTDDISEEDKLLFRDVDRLEALKIDQFYLWSDESGADSPAGLQYFGSTATLRSLKAKYCTLSASDLCRYTNLVDLKLISCTITDVEESREMLGQLRSVKKLRMAAFETEPSESILPHLGSTNTLETLSIGRNVAVPLDVLCRYRNLLHLRIERETPITRDELQLLTSLTRLRTLELSCVFQWQSVIELLIQITTITLLRVESNELGDDDRETFDELLQSRRKENRRILIEVTNFDENVEPPRFLFERDNCRYVEVRRIARVPGL